MAGPYINGTGQHFPNAEYFDSGAIAIDSASAWVLVGTILAGGRRVCLRGDVGAGGALAALKVTQAASIGGVHTDLAVDTDFNAGTQVAAVPVVLGSAIHTTAAGGSFQITLNSGAAEYAIYAKKATGDTTLRITGTRL